MIHGGNSKVSGGDVSVGDEGPSLTVEDLDRTDFVRYAGASGDFTPLHFDEPHARSAGYGGVFAQGMLIAGIASRFVTDWFGVRQIRRFRTRFEDQVWPGESVSVSGHLTGKVNDGRSVELEVEFSVSADDGRTVLTGDAVAVVPES